MNFSPAILALLENEDLDLDEWLSGVCGRLELGDRRLAYELESVAVGISVDPREETARAIAFEALAISRREWLFPRVESLCRLFLDDQEPGRMTFDAIANAGVLPRESRLSLVPLVEHAVERSPEGSDVRRAGSAFMDRHREKEGAKKKGEPYRAAVDFDGVINSYVSGWTGPADLPDPPVPGAIEWLEEMTRSFEVIIFTTRGQYPEARMAIRDWLAHHGYGGPLLAVTHEKPAALVYLDDRAIRFEGVFPSKEEIHRARPWRVK